jgi:hypothetical protein
MNWRIPGLCAVAVFWIVLGLYDFRGLHLLWHLGAVGFLLLALALFFVDPTGRRG